MAEVRFSSWTRPVSSLNHQVWWLLTLSEVRDSGFGHLQLLLIYEQLSRRVKVVFPKRKKLLKLRIKMTKCIIYKGLKKVPDPPLKVSRRQPSAVWSGAQQTPTGSTWISQLCSIFQGSFSGSGSSCQYTEGSLYKWVPTYKCVQWDQLNEKFFYFLNLFLLVLKEWDRNIDEYIVCLLHFSHQGLDHKPGHVPQLGIKPMSLWCMGGCSTTEAHQQG